MNDFSDRNIEIAFDTGSEYEVVGNSLKSIIKELLKIIKENVNDRDIESAIQHQIILEQCTLWLTGDITNPKEELKWIFENGF